MNIELSSPEIKLIIETLEMDLNECAKNALHLDNYHKINYQDIIASLKEALSEYES